MRIKVTMSDVVVLIPVLGRPHRVPDLLESFYGSEREHKLRALFLASPDDYAELQAIGDSGEDYVVMPDPAGPGDYARKMNAGIRGSDEDWVFLGADDLCFCEGWADHAIAFSKATGKRVVGTNDLGNPTVMRGQHATHSLIERSYCDLGTFDDSTQVLHEGYHHNSVDVEFVETAKMRGEFGYCAESMVEHLHYLWSKSVPDATYQRGQSRYNEDRQLWSRRKGELTRSGGSVKASVDVG
jgi:hypothetical protein